VNNFIVKFMPSGAHEVAHTEFIRVLDQTANLLINQVAASNGYYNVASKSESHCFPL
jgi:hypothetical protein